MRSRRSMWRIMLRRRKRRVNREKLKERFLWIRVFFMVRRIKIIKGGCGLKFLKM